MADGFSGGALRFRLAGNGKLAKFADQARSLAEPARGKPSHSPPFGEWNEMPHLSADALAVRVYYEDTDFSGRVYHASYLRFLERGRTEWLRGHGFSHQDFAASSGVVFAVRSLQIDFFSPALMDDLLRVETEVSALRGASIEFRQRIFRGEKELAAATVKVAAIRDGRPARIPPALRRLFEAR